MDKEKSAEREAKTEGKMSTDSLSRRTQSHTKKHSKARSITPGFASKMRIKIAEIVEKEEVDNMLEQMIWSIEEGDLSCKPVPHAFNSAMWLLKKNRWKAPYGMPLNWRWKAA